MDWLLYYKRAVAEAALSNSHVAALRDFTIARYLYRLWPDLCLREGEVWLGLGEWIWPSMPWNEALRRAGNEAPGYYGPMLTLVKGDSVLLNRMRDLIHADKARLSSSWQTHPRLNSRWKLELLLSENPQLRSFSSTELAALFPGCTKMRQSDLIRVLEEHPVWQQIAWRELARAYADREDFHRAYETVLQFTPPPDTRHIRKLTKGLDKLRARFLLNRSDVMLVLRSTLLRSKKAKPTTL